MYDRYEAVMSLFFMALVYFIVPGALSLNFQDHMVIKVSFSERYQF